MNGKYTFMSAVRCYQPRTITHRSLSSNKEWSSEKYVAS